MTFKALALPDTRYGPRSAPVFGHAIRILNVCSWDRVSRALLLRLSYHALTRQCSRSVAVPAPAVAAVAGLHFAESRAAGGSGCSYKSFVFIGVVPFEVAERVGLAPRRLLARLRLSEKSGLFGPPADRNYPFHRTYQYREEETGLSRQTPASPDSRPRQSTLSIGTSPRPRLLKDTQTCPIQAPCLSVPM